MKRPPTVTDTGTPVSHHTDLLPCLNCLIVLTTNPLKCIRKLPDYLMPKVSASFLLPVVDNTGSPYTPEKLQEARHIFNDMAGGCMVLPGKIDGESDIRRRKALQRCHDDP